MRQIMRAAINGALTVGAMVVWAGVAQANPAVYPSPELAQIAKTGKYVGPDKCVECHEEEHAAWHGSRHTVKATKGPAFGKEFEKNIYEWVRRDWDKLDTYMIVDTKDAKTNYMAALKVPMSKVDYVVGQTYKQRYMTYYDGGPLDVYEATTGQRRHRLEDRQVQDGPVRRQQGPRRLQVPVPGDEPQGRPAEQEQLRRVAVVAGALHRLPRHRLRSAAWDQAKAEFKAGKRADLRDIFAADLRVSCEMCHGPGEAHIATKSKKNNIINPAKITDVEARKMVCEQCHTRTQASTHSPLAQDLRGYRLMDKYEDFAMYTRPAWGKGNRQVSIDGKGRRDHQQDMDIRMSTTIQGSHSVHATMACFDCHEQHAIGKPGRKNATLKVNTPAESCVKCHGAQTDKPC
jgi:hypothetical protein